MQVNLVVRRPGVKVHLLCSGFPEAQRELSALDEVGTYSPLLRQNPEDMLNLPHRGLCDAPIPE